MAIKLVVAGSLEDHAVLKYALSSMMPDAQVEVGADGYRALELVHRSHPDLVVVDPAVLEGGRAIAPRVATDLTDRFTHSITRESELTRALAEATTQLQEVASS